MHLSLFLPIKFLDVLVTKYIYGIKDTKVINEVFLILNFLDTQIIFCRVLHIWLSLLFYFI